MLEVLFVVAVFVVMTAWVSANSGWDLGGLIILVASAVVAYFLLGFNVFEYAYQNAETLAYYAALYLVAGLLWTFPKWYIFVKKVRAYHDKMNMSGKPPTFYDNSEKITAWVLFWPFSLAGTVIGDLIWDAITFCLRQYTALYDFISRSAYGVPRPARDQ